MKDSENNGNINKNHNMMEMHQQDTTGEQYNHPRNEDLPVVLKLRERKRKEESITATQGKVSIVILIRDKRRTREKQGMVN